MVIRGNSRGNGRQLGHYLLAKGENEDIRILEVDGQSDAEASALHRAIFAMDISSELSRGKKGLYHAQINPAPGEDQGMDDEHWREASDILGKQLGLENQRRAIVLHSKKGRTHAHVVWERYDHQSGKMVSDSFSRLAQDRARKEMEQSFGHAQTPHRNKHRPELKASLNQLWHQTGTGAQFVKAARQNGYIIATGSGRSPYMVVDEFGRSYDLTRQLQGVRLKDVRQRLRNESLLGEKDAITIARKAANDNQGSGSGTGKQKSSFTIKQSAMSDLKDNRDDITGQGDNKPKPDNSPKGQFGQNKSDVTSSDQKSKQQEPKTANGKFAANKGEVTGQQPQKGVKDQFAENKDDATKKDQQKSGKEKEKQEAMQRMKAMKEKNAKDKNKGPEIG